MLLTDNDFNTRWQAARHPNVDIHDVLGSDDKDVRMSLASAQVHSSDVTVALLDDPDWQVREQLSMATHDEATLARLAADTHPRVRAAAALNPRAPVDLLFQLSRDSSKVVRSCVPWAKAVPREVVSELARDRSADVRWNVVLAQPNRRDLMQQLSDDPDELVAQQARTHSHMKTRS